MGFAFPIRILTKEVTIGFRAKGLLGLAHASVHIDGMDIDLNDREWRADLRGSVNANVAGMNFSDLRGRIELQDVMDRLDPSDIDLNRHVNSTRYVELILNQMNLADFDDYFLSRFEIEYRREAHYNDTVEVASSVVDNGLLTAINLDGQTMCLARSVMAPRENKTETKNINQQT